MPKRIRSVESCQVVVPTDIILTSSTQEMGARDGQGRPSHLHPISNRRWVNPTVPRHGLVLLIIDETRKIFRLTSISPPTLL